MKLPNGSVASPSRIDFKPELIKQLKVASGYQIQVLASGLSSARWLVELPDGSLLLSQTGEDRVSRLVAPPGGAGAGAWSATPYIKDMDSVHGLAIRDKKIYLTTVRTVEVMDWDASGKAGPRKKIADLPTGGNHSRRTLAIGPDGWLYVSIGSTCNSCAEANAEHATILRMRPDGTERAIFAKGLRNTIGFAWHPQTKELWGMDHGADWRGDDLPLEELNQLQAGKDYGWPYCHGDRKPDPGYSSGPKKEKLEDYCAQTVGSPLGFPAHSAPIGFAFDAKGEAAYITFHGSWNRDPAQGYKVVRVAFKDGKPAGAASSAADAVSDFVSGFLSADHEKQLGRPTGILVYHDGSVIFADDANGVIYRVFKP